MTLYGHHLLHEGTLALSKVEHNGIRIDMEVLQRNMDLAVSTARSIESRLHKDDIFRIWKRRFGSSANIDSRTQLGDVLFLDLKLPILKITPTGRPSTKEEILDKIDIPFVKDYLQMQRLKKAANTFLKGIASEVVDGYLHPSFSLHTVQTYRSSSQSPNFHNFPTRNVELSKIIRSCFVSRPGRMLVEIDYSGIEVKIAYCYHKDPVMREYLLDSSKDMHRDMAAQCYMLEPSQVYRQSRYAAKNMFVFPQFYGDYYINNARLMWNAIDNLKLKVKLPEDKDAPTGPSIKEHLAKQGISRLGECDPKKKPVPGTFEYHMQQVEKDFWTNRFGVYSQWKKKHYNDYLRRGYFRTHTGFMLKGLFRRNEVINYPVQAAAFHCLLLSLIELQKRLQRARMKTLIVGQIHDSMLADVPENELQQYIAMAREVMTQYVPSVWEWVNIPLDVEVEVCPLNGSWFDKKVMKV